MARRRTGEIRESLQHFQELEATYASKPESKLISIIRTLKMEPDSSIEQIALRLGCSAATVKRCWRVYQQHGLDAMLNKTAKVRPLRRAGTDITMLTERLLAGSFKDLNDVRAWLAMQPGSSTSPSALDHMAIPASDNGVLRFLSSLSVSTSFVEWVSLFRSALLMLLGDVDNVSVSVNIHCDLVHPESLKPQIVLYQSQTTGKSTTAPYNNAAKTRQGHIRRFIAHLYRTKYSRNDYHPPLAFEYRIGDAAYLGVIVLWRARSAPAISRRTVELMQALNAALVFVLSDYVARYQAAHPVEQAFMITVEKLSDHFKLTVQQRRILVLLLLGQSYDEIAKDLSISVNTVRYHLKELYRRTATHSHIELFTKFFTPRVEDMNF